MLGSMRPQRSQPRSRALRVVAAAALVVVLGVTSGCGSDDDPEADPTPDDTPTGATESPTEASGTPTESTTVAPSDSPTTAEPPVETLVYFLVDDPRGVRLAREPHELAAEGAEATAVGAVTAMIHGPADPDYATTWDPDTQVLGVEKQGRAITVDLSEEARTTDAGSDAAQQMVQQLVYTVTEVLGIRSSVRLLVEGEPVDELWGSVDWSDSVRRDDPMLIRQLVQIDSPAEGGTSGRKVTVSGEAATFEATVPWRVVDGTGAVVRSGFTTAAEGMTLSPYEFTVRLRPGTYSVEVSEDDPSGGEGEPPRTDTRTFTVG